MREYLKNLLLPYKVPLVTREAGLGSAAIYHWMSGRHVPDYVNWLKMCHALARLGLDPKRVREAEDWYRINILNEVPQGAGVPREKK